MTNQPQEIEILEKLFDKAYEAGQDIVMERQFENDPQAYKRYRARVIKPAQGASTTAQNKVVITELGNLIEGIDPTATPLSQKILDRINQLNKEL